MQTRNPVLSWARRRGGCRLKRVDRMAVEGGPPIEVRFPRSAWPAWSRVAKALGGRRLPGFLNESFRTVKRLPFFLRGERSEGEEIGGVELQGRALSDETWRRANFGGDGASGPPVVRFGVSRVCACGWSMVAMNKRSPLAVRPCWCIFLDGRRMCNR